MTVYQWALASLITNESLPLTIIWFIRWCPLRVWWIWFSCFMILEVGTRFRLNRREIINQVLLLRVFFCKILSELLKKFRFLRTVFYSIHALSNYWTTISYGLPSILKGSAICRFDIRSSIWLHFAIHVKCTWRGQHLWRILRIENLIVHLISSGNAIFSRRINPYFAWLCLLYSRFLI